MFGILSFNVPVVCMNILPLRLSINPLVYVFVLAVPFQIMQYQADLQVLAISIPYSMQYFILQFAVHQILTSGALDQL
jgi:hypothetical protein